jgi:hypothetical protein
VINLTVNPLPVVSGFASATMVCAGEPVVFTALGAQTFEWRTSANTMQSGSPITVIPKSSGVYTVIGTDATGCSGESTVLIDVEECTGLSANTRPAGTDIYPNPSAGVFELYRNSAAAGRFEVSDLTGRLILEGSFSGERATIDMSSFSNGIYSVKVTSDNDREVIKIIKATN